MFLFVFLFTCVALITFAADNFQSASLLLHNSGVSDAEVVISVDVFVIAAVCDSSLDITLDSSATCAGDTIVVVFAVVSVDAVDDTPGHGAAHDAVHVAVLLQFGDALRTVLVGQDWCWLRFVRKLSTAASRPQYIRPQKYPRSAITVGRPRRWWDEVTREDGNSLENECTEAKRA